MINYSSDRNKSKADVLRDSVHNLDLENQRHCEIFWEKLMKFIEESEEKEPEAYDDVNGHKTIGIGFNMGEEGSAREKEARKEWEKIFEAEVSFDAAYYKKIILDDTQIYKLLRANIETRISELERIYRGSWDHFRANERIAIISIYFNKPSLVRKRTDFHKYMTKYVETRDAKYLSQAVEYLKRHGSNEIPGLKNRRNLEADMLNSTKSPFYSRPHAPLLPKTLEIRPYTIVPLGLSAKYKIVDSNYFIWRTKLDDKVRLDHTWREGRVFDKRIIAPGTDYNCRCIAEPITENLRILETKMIALLEAA